MYVYMAASNPTSANIGAAELRPQVPNSESGTYRYGHALDKQEGAEVQVLDGRGRHRRRPLTPVSARHAKLFAHIVF